MRTIDEIASWGTMSDARRLDVWARLGERRRQAAATPPSGAPSLPVSGAARGGSAVAGAPSAATPSAATPPAATPPAEPDRN